MHNISTVGQTFESTAKSTIIGACATRSSKSRRAKKRNSEIKSISSFSSTFASPPRSNSSECTQTENEPTCLHSKTPREIEERMDVKAIKRDYLKKLNGSENGLVSD